MFPHKQFDSRQLSFGQNFNNTNNPQLGISPNMQNQNITQSANMEDGSSFHSNSSMNISTRHVSQNRSFSQDTALQFHSAGSTGARNSFLPPNSGGDRTFFRTEQRPLTMADNDPMLSAPGNVGYNRMHTHQINAMPAEQMQSSWRQEIYPPRNFLTENTQMMSIPNYMQRQPPHMKSSEASASQTLTKVTPSTAVVTPEKKKPSDQDVYKQFHMIGSVEQVISWNQMAKGRKCYITYELHGFLESITEECPGVSIFWIKQDLQNGPVIQGVFCNMDRRLTDKVRPGNYIVCYGRMIKTKIMQVFNAHNDIMLDAGIKRVSFLCHRSLHEFINSPHQGN